MDADGDATVVWLLDDGSNEIVQAATGRGGSFSAPVPLSGDGGNASSAAVVMNPAGDAVASWMRADAGVTELEAAIMRADGSFPAPDGQGDGSIIGEAESVSTVKPAEPLVQQQVVMGGHGEALATWRALGGGGEVRVARLGAHVSAFGVSATLGNSTARPSVAMNESGEAVVGWPVALGVEVATASAGGAFGAPAYLATVLGRGPKVANLAIAPDGAVAMAWVDARETSNGEISGEVGEEGVVRPPGGSFSAPRGVFSGGYRLGVGSLELASDEQGDAFGMWQENTIIGDRVVAMTFDHGPVIGTVSAPTTGQTGQALSFSISTPVSVWKPVRAITWDFGDGTTGSGLSTTHTYTQPGVYTVTVTASDNQSLPFRINPEYVQTSVTRTVTITSPPNATPPPGVVARSAPTITGASQSHNVWREGRGLARMSRDRRQPPIGTRFSFSVNESARVSLAFTQVVDGRKVKGQCIAQTMQNHESRSCRQMAGRGTLSFGATSGRSNLSFQGRVSRQGSLKPGRYLVTITAVNAAGERSSPTSLAFTIVK
ncbi:MAG TPA: PKD domain-containing protein [Solirubrobacteraceae bacterium]